MIGTDPALDPRTLFIGASIAGGFATVAAMLAIALTGNFVLALFGVTLPMAVLLVGALDYPDSTDNQGRPDPIRDTNFPEMTTELDSETHRTESTTSGGLSE